MAQNQSDWDMELEESAQGTDSFTAPGNDIHVEEARASAAEWSAGETDNPAGSERVEAARVRRRLLGDALNDLEAALAAPSAKEGWVETVTAGVHEVREALQEHMEVTEGRGGLLEEIRDVAPRLSNEIALIEAEHVELAKALEMTEHAISHSSDTSKVRSEAMTVMSKLSLHRQRGADLVYEAYNIDIAAGD